MPALTFGERLKREREMRGVSLEEVSLATRISVRYLEALEAGQWQALPGGGFNRGFIRTVARYLGMDEESVLAEYALATKDEVGPPPRDLRPIQLSARWPRPMVGAVVVVLLLVTLCVWIVYRNRHKSNHSRLQTPASRYDTVVNSRPSRGWIC